MIGPIIVSIGAAALIAVYMLIVNRFLRSDEHYHSQTTEPLPQNPQRQVNMATAHAHA